MRSRIVTRWHCDYCKVGKFTRPAMVRHEVGCTNNPNRVCKMCAMADLEQKPMTKLLTILADSSWGIDPATGEEDKPVQREKELREATGGCPACILATLRQTKNSEVQWSITFKDEAKAWISEYTHYTSYEY